MRWGGSKASKARKIVRMIPHDIRHYYEPFCGYFSVFRRVIRDFPDLLRYSLNDKNSDLIAWMRSVEAGSFHESLVVKRKKLLPELEHEDEIREEFEASKDRWLFDGDCFAWFFLHCYAIGQYVSRDRANIASFDPGYFNHGLRCETLRRASQFREMLNRAEITCCDALPMLRDLNERADASHFAYIDPPYLPPERRFDMYQEDFTESQHAELMEILKVAKFRFLLSMGDGPQARRLYVDDKSFKTPYRKDRGFLVRPMLYYYTGHSRKQHVLGRGKKTKTKEWLISNYDHD